MNPADTRVGRQVHPPEDRAKMAFDQQKLTSRLVRSKGRDILQRTSVPEQDDVMHSQTQHINPESHTKLALSSKSSPSVSVPIPLQPMLGSKLHLKATASQTMLSGKLSRVPESTNNVEHHVNPEDKPASKRARTAQVTNTLVTMSNPTRPTAPVGVDINSPEYLEYLKSPFSFIDKVIENPFTEEFVYLISDEPYHLRIVRHDEINPNDYYTMSRAGVTHFLNGEATFTSLDQWEREYFLYVKMRQIDFFARYRSWKAFYFWKKLINNTKMTKYSKYLKEHHFLLNKVLCAALLKLKHLCVEASTWNILKLDLRVPQTLASFRAIQSQQREQIEELLTQLCAESVKLLAEACDTDLKHFLIANGFRKSDNSIGNDALRDGSSASNSVISGLSRNVISTNESGQKISRAEKAAQRTRLRRLLKYIQLADLHITHTLANLCRERADELLRCINRDVEITLPNIDARLNTDGTPLAASSVPIGAMALRAHTQAHGSLSTHAASSAAATAMNASVNATSMLKKKRNENRHENPLFVVEVELDTTTGALSFSPSLEEYQIAIDQAIDAAAVKTMTRTKLCNEELFEEYVASISLDEDMDDRESQGIELVLNDERVIQIKEDIKSGLEKAFEIAWMYASNLQPFANMYLENQNTDINNYANSPVHTFSELITKYETQLINCYALRTLADLGIIAVDTSKFRELIIPSPAKMRNEVMTLMPIIAREKCLEMLTELTKYNDELSRIPDDVADFVNIMTLLKNISDNQEATNHRFVFIQEMYGVMQDAQVKLSDKDKILLEQLSQMRHQFKTTVMLTEASLQGNIEKFTKDLEGKLPELMEELSSVLSALQDPLIYDTTSEKDAVIELLKDTNTQLKRIENLANNYQHYQEILGAEISQYDKLREARFDLNIKLEIWEALKSWEDFTDRWLKTPFSSIDVEVLSKELSMYSKTYGRSKRRLEGAAIVDLLKSNIDEFGSVLPIISDLRNPFLLDRHWSEINRLLQHNIVADPNFCLSTLLDRNAITHANAINVISFRARQEAVLQGQLSKLQNTWSALNFPILPYKNQKDVHILGTLDDILIVLDESIVTLSSILGSHYVEPLRREALDLSHQLSQFQIVLEEWTQCQRQWMYLESIFSWQDIVRQLPDESTLFSQVTKGFIQIMRRTADNPNCLTAGLYGGMKEAFMSYNLTLDKINKQLESYLETKRMAFPRFYFISNDELIQIMSNQKSHHNVQAHLRKCFDNLVKLEFQDKDIKAMISAEGERVPLGQNLKVRNNVETWLGDLEKDMVKSLRKYMKRGLNEYDAQPRAQWILDKFGQVVMTVSQIVWSRNVERALVTSGDKQKALSKWYDAQLKQLTELTAMVRGNINDIERRKLVALITTDVHARDVTNTLMQRNVNDIHSFDWQQQLRFYWDTNEDDCVIRQANTRLLYGYEYVGVASRLVITPLTDRCWITITGALHIRYGASPAGPAGTGKTESVKDLAKALGIFCVVFNCSEQMNYMMMQKFFCGLAQTGTWACLDEFNRIDIEVLSVIAQQLLQIRQALLQNLQVFTFQGQSIKLQKSCGVMITMNPGYAGRTELPDNLKVLFRPVAMMVPDYAMIAEIMLFSEGFENATVLSKKMHQLYKLASEQLSQQDHYDFGMRAVKSVLVTAGALRRAEPDVDESTVLIRAMRDSNVPKFVAQDLPLFDAIVQDLFPDTKIPNIDHGELHQAITTTLVENNLQPVPKFVNKVLQLWDTLSVRFGVMLVGPNGGGKSCVWKTLSGSMTRLKEMEKYGDKYNTVHTHVLNPKSVSMGELFGELNELSQEWKEGIASNLFREAITDNSSDRHWVVFDGPVDSLWVENMNTVLDDSMMLCLPTGERIKLKHEIRVVFEVNDLAVASPATVSRCGMVYVTPSDLGVMPYVKSWLETMKILPKSVRDYLLTEFSAKLPQGLAYIHEAGVQPITCSDLSLVVSICRILEVLFDPLIRAIQHLESVDHADAIGKKAETLPEADVTSPVPPGTESVPTDPTITDASGAPAAAATEVVPATPMPAEEVAEPWYDVLEKNKFIIDMCFAFAYAWGMGGSLDSETQPGFSKILHELFIHVKPPGTFYDVYLDFHEKCWKPWEELVAPYKYNPSHSFFQIIVPTADTVKYRTLGSQLLGLSHPVFLTGPTGVGKTVLLQDMLTRMRKRSVLLGDKHYDESKHGSSFYLNALTSEEREALESRYHMSSLNMIFSAQSSSFKTQETIESRLIKLKANQLGAPQGRRFVMHIDDVNMPSVEKYGAQPPIELLRQLLDYGGFYDRSTLTWKDIDNFTLLCSSAPPGGGRSVLPPRFTRHFTTLCMPSPSESNLRRIFSSMYTGWVTANSFKQAIVKLVDPIVTSTLELYHAVSKELLPTPAKSHYTFNLRDISKVFQGILSIKPIACNSATVMTRLWIHECQRCFEDRLINTEDQLWCTQKLTQLVQKNFGVDWRHDALFKSNFITFCDFMSEGDKLYEEVVDSSKLVNVLDSYLESYNMAHPTKQMKLVFFEDAVKYLTRISRIIRQPRGNAMLVGVGGSGKQSLTRLACFIADYECAQIQVSKNFTHNDFREFLKKICITAGVKGQNIVFLLNEQEILEERFLEDVNNLLNNGEVPNLYPRDEQQKVLEDLANVLREERSSQEMIIEEDNNDANALYNTFINRIRDNLHIVLCLSPVGDAFRQRLRMFPSLINCTTIDWFMPWPKEALLSVAKAVLSEIDCGDDDVRNALAELSVHVHTTVGEACIEFKENYRRHVYTTPKTYLDMLSLYRDMLVSQREKVDGRRTHLLNGLRRLKDTQAVVANLQETLEKLRPTLIEKARETEILLKKVAEDSEKADQVRALVEIDEKQVSQQTAIVREEEASARANLEIAMPALREAVKALEKMRKSEISEVKSLPSPPVQVVKVLEAVCILLNEPPDWDSAKRVLANVNFVKQLRDYPKQNMDAKMIRKLNKYVTDPQLASDKMILISKPACSMMLWVQAMHTYYHVDREVAPKAARVNELMAKLEEAEARLKSKQDELNAVVENVRMLQERCRETEAEKAALDHKSRQTEARLDRAQQLIELLSGEEIRWTEDAANLENQLKYIVGDVFIATACVSYYGAFTGDYRAKLLNQWLTSIRNTKIIPVSDNFTLQSCLGNSMDIRQWQINGLPTDDVSTDSALLCMYSSRYPLLIDPQEQAKKWLKLERKNRLHITRMGAKDMVKKLELCLRNGYTLLIEDIGESVDSILDPLLYKQFFTHGGRTMVRIGESDIDYDPRFQLFLTTKLSNPIYLPEVCIKVNTINFTVTHQGLEDQLLGEVVRRERSDIEEKKNRLVVSMAQDRKELSNIEEKILTMLQESQTLILDDIDLINTLKESKATSQVIMERVKQARETQESIEAIRQQYIPVAVRGSLLYFVIADLALIDPMYQYSLEFFIRFFTMCIDQTPATEDIPTRISSLLDTTTLLFFNNVCRGLFEKHKALFSFSVLSAILLNSKTIDHLEWNTLLRGASLEKVQGEVPKNPFSTAIISDLVWLELYKISNTLPAFADIPDSMIAHTETWADWILNDNIANIPLPLTFDSLPPFSKLLLIKTVRLHHFPLALRSFMSNYHEGRALVNPAQASLADTFKESASRTPIVFILSTGADPTSLLFRLADDMGISDRLHVLSLGQGQGEKAKKLVENAMRKGDWVLLQNCHLAKSWMPQLESIVEQMDNTDEQYKILPSFRLWLTSMPSTDFPVSVLQKGIKITNEPPQGIRANLLRSYTNVLKPEDFSDIINVVDETAPPSVTPKVYANLVYNLCFFHAVIQERHKFGPLGWNKTYEFNDSDLETAVTVLRMALSEHDHIPWETLSFMIGQICYGGRVTDDWDRRCLMTVLRQFYSNTAVADEYSHSFTPSNTYHTPYPHQSNDAQVYIDTITKFPANDEPEIFGMDTNANITHLNQRSLTMLNTLLILQPRTSLAGGSSTTEDVVVELAHDMEMKLPSVLDIREAGPTTFAVEEDDDPFALHDDEDLEQDDDENDLDNPNDENKQISVDSLAEFLKQEMERCNLVLNTVKTSLSDLQRAVKGLVVMSSELDTMYTSLLNNQVPEIWKKVSPPTLKSLSSWITDLHARVAALRDWLRNGKPNSFWLSGFFFQQGFITGVLQTHARRYRIPIDTISFSHILLDHNNVDELPSGPEDGVYVHGLYTTGAQWNVEESLLEDAPTGVLVSELPILHLLPRENYKQPSGTYMCPVYKTAVRAGELSTTGHSTNFVLDIHLPSSKNPDYWILKGVAVLCQPDSA